MKEIRFKGFTLIELLVVITIIGILATLLMSNYIGVRARARDAQRKSDLRQIQTALEQYRSDNNATPYPSTLPSCGSSFTNGSGTTYMQKIPCDPLSTASSPLPYYYFFTDSTHYAIASCLENGNDKDVVTAVPSWWPPASTWPPSGLSCSSAYYYVSSNP